MYVQRKAVHWDKEWLLFGAWLKRFFQNRLSEHLVIVKWFVVISAHDPLDFRFTDALEFMKRFLIEVFCAMYPQSIIGRTVSFCTSILLRLFHYVTKCNVAVEMKMWLGRQFVLLRDHIILITKLMYIYIVRSCYWNKSQPFIPWFVWNSCCYFF